MVVAADASDAGLACVLAAVVEERDPFSARRDEVSVDIALRVSALTGGPAQGADQRTVRRVRRTAEDIARRAGVHIDGVDPDRCGAVLALAFPDRLAIRRGSPGRFQLRGGTTAWIPNNDPLAVERCIVAADLDGKRKDSRIRLAAAIDVTDIEILFADAVTVDHTVEWSRDRLVNRRVTRLGGLVLAETEHRAEPGPGTVELMLERIRRDPSSLTWSDAALRLRQRVAFARAHHPDEGWPDWSDDALSTTPETWIGDELWLVTSLDELALIDLHRVLNRRLPHDLRSVLQDRAPDHCRLPSGRTIPVDYSTGEPAISGRVQDFFGLRRTPEAGGVPMLVTLLSPANRPVQVTRDLEGFWDGSWHEVRKEMAGRYPKHDWPEHPD
jgi:ATP-dependent helicase HrpB